jgi:hypothetical protein
MAFHSETRWDAEGLRDNFEVLGYAAGYVVVIRRADGVKGTLEFTHRPRFYFNFQPSQNQRH